MGGGLVPRAPRAATCRDGAVRVDSARRPRRSGDKQRRVRAGHVRAGADRLRAAQLRERPELPGHVPHPPVRQRRAARAVPARTRERRDGGLLRPDRGGGRLRRRGHGDPGPQGRRFVRPERDQDVDQQRRNRRGGAGLGQRRRRRRAGLPGADRRGRLHGEPGRTQDEPQGVGHQRAGPGRRPRLRRSDAPGREGVWARRCRA